MPRPPLTVWAWLLLAFAGCSLVTEFDRDNLGAQPGVDEAGIVGSSMDAQVGPSADATMSGGEDSAPPASCQNHDDCGRTRLCCNGSCLPVTETNCSDCGQGCSPTAANTCNERVCGCGGGAACSGGTPHCSGEGAAAKCVQCRDGGDCAAGMQCVRGTCAQCDPMNNSGCSGNTPICNANTLRCEACRANPDNCPGTPVCTSSGACGGCTANDAADCTSPTSPICNLSASPSVCRGCASNAECMTELSRPYCINNERCSVCNPADDSGCTAGSATPDCRLNANGVYQCQGCMNGTCGTGQVCNLSSGRCVQCRNDNDCDTNSATPWCDTASGTCRGCNFVPNSLGGGTTWCALATILQSPARPVCNAGSGRCVRCNANGDCPNNQRCYTPEGMPQNNICGACRPNVAADCPAGMPICDPAMRTCRACRVNNQTLDCPTPAARVCNAATGGCVACLLDTNAGCTNPNQPRCLMGPAGPVCGQCGDEQHSVCPPEAPLCNPATRTCVPCNTAALPDDDRGDRGCGERSTGYICASNGTCAQCEMAGNRGCGTGLCCPGERGLQCFDRSPMRCASCANACTVPTPVCQPTLNICGCNSTSCPMNQMCMAGACVPIPAGTGAATTTGAAF